MLLCFRYKLQTQKHSLSSSRSRQAGEVSVCRGLPHGNPKCLEFGQQRFELSRYTCMRAQWPRPLGAFPHPPTPVDLFSQKSSHRPFKRQLLRVRCRCRCAQTGPRVGAFLTRAPTLTHGHCFSEALTHTYYSSCDTSQVLNLAPSRRHRACFHPVCVHCMTEQPLYSTQLCLMQKSLHKTSLGENVSVIYTMKAFYLILNVLKSLSLYDSKIVDTIDTVSTRAEME